MESAHLNNNLKVKTCTIINVVGAAACGSACFGEGTGNVHYRDVVCPSLDAQSISECMLSTVGTGDCSKHDRDAGAICGMYNRYISGVLSKLMSVASIAGCAIVLKFPITSTTDFYI